MGVYIEDAWMRESWKMGAEGDHEIDFVAFRVGGMDNTVGIDPRNNVPR
jgi:hypothetical protein